MVHLKNMCNIVETVESLMTTFALSQNDLADNWDNVHMHFYKLWTRPICEGIPSNVRSLWCGTMEASGDWRRNQAMSERKKVPPASSEVLWTSQVWRQHVQCIWTSSCPWRVHCATTRRTVRQWIPNKAELNLCPTSKQLPKTLRTQSIRLWLMTMGQHVFFLTKQQEKEWLSACITRFKCAHGNIMVRHSWLSATKQWKVAIGQRKTSIATCLQTVCSMFFHDECRCKEDRHVFVFDGCRCKEGRSVDQDFNLSRPWWWQTPTWFNDCHRNCEQLQLKKKTDGTARLGLANQARGWWTTAKAFVDRRWDQGHNGVSGDDGVWLLACY